MSGFAVVVFRVVVVDRSGVSITIASSSLVGPSSSTAIVANGNFYEDCFVYVLIDLHLRCD